MPKRCRGVVVLSALNLVAAVLMIAATAAVIRSACKCRSTIFAFLIRSACKCRSIVFAFLILFFFPFFVPDTGPLTRYLKTGCSESVQTWQSGRSP